MFSRILAALVLVLAAASAHARIGAIDQVPAATLLFPHFEVDPTSPSGVNTILTLQNASATAVVVNVTLWTDFGLPTANFVLYLTGYDADTIDLRRVFGRRVPITADDGLDPTDTISPQGIASQDINFPGTTETASAAQGNAISRTIVAAHSGGPDANYFGGNCGARNYGDGRARGYVTVDTMNTQDADNPTVAGYFSTTTTQNVMLGDYVVVDPRNRAIAADTAVHIEASSSDPITAAGANKQTFYGRFVGFSAADNREPLPTAWAARHAAGRTSVSYWRDPGVTGLAPFACGGSPAALPSGQRLVTVFNANGTVSSQPTGNLFPFTDTTVPGSAIGLTPAQGWVFVNLNLPAPSGPLGAIRQSWTTWLQIPTAAPAVAGPYYLAPGVQLGNAAFAGNPVIP